MYILYTLRECLCKEKLQHRPSRCMCARACVYTSSARREKMSSEMKGENVKRREEENGIKKKKRKKRGENISFALGVY